MTTRCNRNNNDDDDDADGEEYSAACATATSIRVVVVLCASSVPSRHQPTDKAGGIFTVFGHRAAAVPIFDLNIQLIQIHRLNTQNKSWRPFKKIAHNLV